MDLSILDDDVSDQGQAGDLTTVAVESSFPIQGSRPSPSLPAVAGLENFDRASEISLSEDSGFELRGHRDNGEARDFSARMDLLDKGTPPPKTPQLETGGFSADSIEVESQGGATQNEGALFSSVFAASLLIITGGLSSTSTCAPTIRKAAKPWPTR